MFSVFALSSVLRQVVLPRPFRVAIRTYAPLANVRPRGDPVQEWNFLRKHMTNSEETTAQSLDKRWEERSRTALDEAALRPPANPYSGRSVKVLDGNVSDAYKRLETILGRNKVRAQLRLAERHEKRGAKRRRLSSERWRKQFAHEVRKKVQLVTKIRNRGA